VKANKKGCQLLPNDLLVKESQAYPGAYGYLPLGATLTGWLRRTVAHTPNIRSVLVERQGREAGYPTLYRGCLMAHLSWWKRVRRGGVLGSVMVTALGCPSPRPVAVDEPAALPVSLTQVRATPDAYMGQTVVWGGDIVWTQTLQAETRFEVLQKPLDAAGRPLVTDQSEGHFLVRCATFLDPAIYTSGRERTVTGQVEGARTEKIGEQDYRYPLIGCAHLVLWPPRASRGALVGGPPWPWGYGDPWYGTVWSWWWDPYDPSWWVPSPPRFRHHGFPWLPRRGRHHPGGAPHR